jgi:hypothetical protein
MLILAEKEISKMEDTAASFPPPYLCKTMPVRFAKFGPACFDQHKKKKKKN